MATNCQFVLVHFAAKWVFGISKPPPASIQRQHLEKVEKGSQATVSRLELYSKIETCYCHTAISRRKINIHARVEKTGWISGVSYFCFNN